MYQFKRMATMALAASMCLAMLAGCGNKQTDEDDSGLDEVSSNSRSRPKTSTLRTCRKSRKLTFWLTSATCRK